MAKNDLPLSWTYEQVKDLCAFNPKHDKNVSDDLEVSFVPMSAVDDQTGTIQRHDYKLLGEIRKGYTHFADGDVIFAKITPCMENGKLAVARELCNSIACGSTEFHVLRSYGAMLPEYLHSFLRQESYLQTAAGAMTGVVGQRRVPKDFILDTKIPLPPLNEQRRIVAKIEALKARSQKAKEALEAIPALLDQFRQSVLAAAFRGDLTADWREKNPDVEPASVLLERIRAERRHRWEEAELEKMKANGKKPTDDRWKSKYKEPTRLEEDLAVNYPDSWTWVRAEEVCDFITKGTTPAAQKMFEQGDIPFIKVYNLTNRGELDFSINPTFISKDVHNGELARSKVFSGDVLMNIVGPPLGKVAIVPSAYEEWNMNQAIAVYRGMPGIENHFLCYCLLSAEILSIAVNAAKATAGQFNLTLEICRDLPLPIPPTSEQQQIIAIVERFFAAADLIAEQVADAVSQNEVLNQSILAKAFRGELVPQDPNDEPASALLERIQAERAKQEAEAKTAKKSTGKTTGQRIRKAKQQDLESIQLGLPGLE